MKEEKIKITDLKLWSENPRFPKEYFNKSEKELINYLFNKKGEKEKLKDLAKSIIENINLIPWERLIVYSGEDEYVVLEGNRRVIIYKLLLNPSLLEDKKLSSIFEKSKGIIDNSLKVDCLVTDNMEKGLKYVELKHLETGYKSWGEPEKNNFKRTRGSEEEKIIIKTEIDKIVRNLDIPEKLKEDVLGHGFVTTFYRIIAEATARKHFGYEIKDNNLLIKDKDFKDKLKIIIWNVLNKKDSKGKKLDSRSLNKIEEINKYLTSLDVKKEISKLNEEIKSSYETKIDVFNKKTKEFVSPTEKKQKNSRKTKIQMPNGKLFGKSLFLKQGPVNNLYCAIDKVYEQNKNNESSLHIVLPIIGMSLRLILDIAAREYYKEKGDKEISKSDALYKKFIKEVKEKYRNMYEQEKLNYVSLDDIFKMDFEALLGKYAHGNIIFEKSQILTTSKIVGEILEIFFRR